MTTTLPETPPETSAEAAEVIPLFLTESIREHLQSSDNQAVIVDELCALTKLPSAVVWPAVKYLAAAAVGIVAGASAAGSNAAGRRLAGWLVGSDVGKKLYIGLRDICARFDKITAGGVEIRDRINKLDPNAAAYWPYLSRQDRSAMAMMTSLDRLEQGISAIRSDIAELNDALWPAPDFKRFDFAPDDDKNRFYFGTRSISFIPRPNDTAVLNEFLNHEAPFRWMVVHGAGGVGKSRFALEYCRALNAGWERGFLSTPETAKGQPDWTRWRPDLPHFLVIDYPDARPNDVAALLQALAAKAEENIKGRTKIRVVLLERSNGGQWRTEAAKGNDGRLVEKTEHQPLALQALANPWPIFISFLGEQRAAALDKDAVLTDLKRLDPEVRPLFASFYADALARGANPTEWDREQLVKEVLKQDENRYWWRDFSGDESDKKMVKRLAAVVTLAGGCGRAGVETICNASEGDLFPSFDPNRTIARLQLLNGSEADGGVAALQPDMVGELMVLEQLRDLATTNGREENAPLSLLDTAYATAGWANVGAALLRCWRDYDEHDVFAAGSPIGDAIRIVLFFVSSVEEPLSDANWRIFTQIVENRPSPSLRDLQAMAAFNLINHLRAEDMTRAIALYEELKTLAADHDEAALREEQAKAVFNLINHLRAEDMTRALALYEELKALAADHQEAALREEQANAVVNLIIDLGAEDMTRALALYEELKALAADHQEAAVREEQAKAAFNLIIDLGAEDMTRALALYEELKTLAANHQEAALREHQAKAVVNLIIDLGAEDMTRALALYEELKTLAADHHEAALRENQAKAVVNLINHLGAEDMTRALALYEELKALAADHDEAALREEQAKAVVNLIYHLGAEDVTRAIALYKELKTLAANHQEAALREEQANAAFNLINHLRAEDMTRALALYEELKTLAADHHEAALRENQAKAVVNLINHLGAEDMTRALALYEELKALAADHDEAALREEQAKAVVNLIYHLGAEDVTRAIALYKELKTLAANHQEAALREEQAKAVVNLINHLGAEDMTRALALYEELKALAADHDEAALRERQANAAFNLINHLGAEDMTRALALYEELKTLAANHQEAALREEQAKAAFNLIVSLGSSDPLPEKIERLHAEIVSIALTDREEKIMDAAARATLLIGQAMTRSDSDLAAAFITQTIKLDDQLTRLIDDYLQGN